MKPSRGVVLIGFTASLLALALLVAACGGGETTTTTRAVTTGRTCLV